MKSKFIHIIILTLLTSCATEPPPLVRETPLVIEGWIDAGGNPVVIVTTRVPALSTEQNYYDLAKHIVTEAKVTVSDGLSSAELSGRKDTDFFPPYIYTTDEIQGAPGRTYTLNVEYGKFKAYAKTTIPEPVNLIGAFSEVSEKSDTLFNLYGRFQDNPDTKERYKFFTKVEGKDRMFLPSFLSLVDDSDINGEAIILISRGISPLSKYKQLRFRKGEKVQIKFCTIDEDTYLFWKDFDSFTGMSHNILFPPNKNLRTNIHGAFGLWAGYGASFSEITIE